MSKEPTLLGSAWEIVASNLGTKIISVIIAVVLWFIVLESRNVEATKEISLDIVTAADILPANDVPDKVAFRLSGPKAFLRTVLDRHDEPIRINLATNKPGLVTYRIFSDNIRVPIGVKILSITPTLIPIKLEYIKHRDVPVRLELRGTPAEGTKITRTSIVPDVVRIKGAESRIDSLSEIPTVPIDISDLKENVEREVALELNRYNVQLEGPLPKVKIEVEAGQANYRIKDVDIRVQSLFKSRLDEKSVTVLVKASPKDLQSLDRSRVYAVVDLSGKSRGEYHEKVRVTLPENVSLVKVIPEKVKVTLY